MCPLCYPLLSIHPAILNQILCTEGMGESCKDKAEDEQGRIDTMLMGQVLLGLLSA